MRIDLHKWRASTCAECVKRGTCEKTELEIYACSYREMYCGKPIERDPGVIKMDDRKWQMAKRRR